MVTQNVDILITVLPALIGAVGGSLGGNFISDWLKKRDENEKVRKDLTNKYLIQLQNIVQSFYGRLHNMKDRGGAEYMKSIKGNDEYYTISTLYSLGGILAYDRILMLEGVYSQMEYIYPNFGSLLIAKFDQFGIKLDNLKITNQQTGRRVKFFRYDRMLLGDTLTEDKNGTLSLSSYKRFKEGLDTDDKTKSSLQPARDFVENLPFSSAEELDRLMDDLKFILEKLEQRTNIPIHPKS